MIEEDWDNTGLCCCEYYDKEQQRNHILACCCNCYELDDCCDSIICCRGTSMSQIQSVISKIQDRFRIPWRGGAKQISLDAVAPIVLLPLILMISTIHLWISISMGFLIIILITCAYNIHARHQTTTKFFLMWTVSSVLLIWCIFEFKVEPLLEITLEENIAFNILYNSAIYCIYKIRKSGRDLKNELSKINVIDDAQQLIIEIKDDQDSTSFCQFCKCKKNDGITHCYICHCCIENQEYHNPWFDCCIGKHNRRLYVLFLLLSSAALLFESNLTLTTVCNNFIFFKTILLPNDCSEVYDQIDLTICFLMGAYSLILGLLILFYFIQQCWYISLGINGKEFRHLTATNRFKILFFTSRPHSKGVIGNWYHFLFRSQ